VTARKGVWVFMALMLVAGVEAGEPARTVSIVTDKAPGAGARHGTGKVEAALKTRRVVVDRAGSLGAARGKILIVAGLATGNGPAAALLKAHGIAAPDGAEALVVRRLEHQGKPLVLLAGSDDRGVMYALLDVADRIGWAAGAAGPLSEVRDAREKPFVPERALSIYTMHRKHVESFFYDEAYWARFLDTLAENRWSSFVLILGYSPATYFAPPYPFFFDVDGFPQIRVEGLSKAGRKRNLDALNRIIAMTHERGLDFTLGIWDHIPRKPRGYTLPVGVTKANLVSYTKAAIAKLLRVVPELDAIQFRMHWESGLPRDERVLLDFWGSVFQMIKDADRDIRVDVRAKGLPDSVIARGIEVGVPLRVTTKYWMEQMGLPFHPTHIHPKNQHDRRHGYADLLRYPQKFKMHWKLWNGGTTRILLWGSPDYARRFAASTHLYGGEGYEVNAPLATKMAMFPREEPFDLLAPEHRYYDYEFERYWHFFQTFGRAGYNPDTPPEVWRRAFERRFGSDAAPFVEKGLHRASQILPRIVAYSYPYNLFPTLTGWAERRRQGDLPDYAEALPSDTQQFLSIDQAARNRLDGKESAKVHPLTSSRWFAQTASDILGLVGDAEKRIGTKRSKEFVSTMVDLRILAGLALYHSHRARAGFWWALHKRSGGLHALDDAIRHEGKAVKAWEKIVEAAGNVYCDNLMFGRGLSGHWKDELVKLEQGVAKLRKKRAGLRPSREGKGLAIAHVPLRRAAPGKELVIRATVSGNGPASRVQLAYTADGDGYSRVAMQAAEPHLYQAAVPAAKVARGLRYFIEADDGQGRVAAFPAKAPAAKPLTVTARVSDRSGVKWVRLRYRSVSQFFDYKTLEMRPTGRDNEYQAVVPGEHLPREWDFMYLFEVMDTQGNGKIYPDLEKETPYVVVRLER